MCTWVMRGAERCRAIHGEIVEAFWGLDFASRLEVNTRSGLFFADETKFSFGNDEGFAFYRMLRGRGGSRGLRTRLQQRRSSL